MHLNGRGLILSVSLVFLSLLGRVMTIAPQWKGSDSLSQSCILITAGKGQWKGSDSLSQSCILITAGKGHDYCTSMEGV